MEYCDLCGIPLAEDEDACCDECARREGDHNRERVEFLSARWREAEDAPDILEGASHEAAR